MGHRGKNQKKREARDLHIYFIKGGGEEEIERLYRERYGGEEKLRGGRIPTMRELRPGTASRVADIENIKWTDTEWMTT